MYGVLQELIIHLTYIFSHKEGQSNQIFVSLFTLPSQSPSFSIVPQLCMLACVHSFTVTIIHMNNHCCTPLERDDQPCAPCIAFTSFPRLCRHSWLAHHSTPQSYSTPPTLPHSLTGSLNLPFTLPFSPTPDFSNPLCAHMLTHPPKLTFCVACARQVRERHTKLEEFAGWLACLRRVQAQEGQRQQHQEIALALWDMYLAYGGKPLPDQQDKFDEMKEDAAVFQKVHLLTFLN